jgi:hypothetical protein
MTSDSTSTWLVVVSSIFMHQMIFPGKNLTLQNCNDGYYREG